jgi:hypothetical protein
MLWAAMRALAPMLSALLGLGCTPDFDEVWQVKDLRLLALRAEPPEVILPLGATDFPPVKITALVADPLAPPDALFDWSLTVCSADENRCEIARTRTTVASARSKLDAVETSYTLDAAMYRAALEADPLRGFGGAPVMVELEIRRERYSARAVKRIVYGVPLPAQKKANANPTVARVQADGKELATRALEASVGAEEVKLLPEPGAGDREHYWVVTYTGGSRELDEYLTYAFFTTAGTLSDATTGGKPSPFVEKKKVDDVSSDWTPPKEPGGAQIWIVVHDDRGGVGWTTIAATTR